MDQARSIFEGENRAFLIALLVSLALHFFLLLVLPQLREAQHRRSYDPLHARVVEPPQKPVVAPVTPAAVAEVPKLAPHVAPKRPQPARVPPAAPITSQAATPNEAPVLPRNEPVSAEPAVLPAPAPAAIVVASVPQPASPASDAIDAGTLAQYRLSIMSAARRFKRYPRIALDQNWQGRVEVRMVIAASGEISALTVRSSTGYAVLDEHAREMIERAKELATIPPALRGKELTLDIPVVFSLREAGG